MTRYRALLLLCVALVAALTFIAPPYPHEILLQHIPTAVALGLLAISHRFLPISDRSLTMLVLFLLVHIVGARWIYSFVPYDRWSQTLLGVSISEAMGWHRNHYDRFVHFMYGVLFAYPIREFCLRRLLVSRRFASYIALEFTMATSMLYEVVEWGLAMALAPDAAERYNGQQGDMWDAQKDMVLASLGAVVTLTVIEVRRAWGRDSRPSKDNASSVQS
jgi:putative membrane protein